ncbi:MAG TPA: DinB family protein, partial [Pirellulaceae bacterium]|nr:DinB family protein [Pirellulaceae bacterium]
DVVNRFCKLRDESLSWLRSMEQPDWNQTHNHPQHGPFRAGDILAAWAAHDYFHLRQIAKRMYELARRIAFSEHPDHFES